MREHIQKSGGEKEEESWWYFCETVGNRQGEEEVSFKALKHRGKNMKWKKCQSGDSEEKRAPLQVPMTLRNMEKPLAEDLRGIFTFPAEVLR